MSREIQIIKLDNIPQRLILNEHSMTLTTYGITHIANGITGDERIGARIYLYRGGAFWVHPDLDQESGNQTRLTSIGRILTMFGFGFHKWYYRATLGSSESIPWYSPTREKATK